MTSAQIKYTVTVTSHCHRNFYLDAYLEDSTPEELRNALATVARSKGISDLARRSGLSRLGIYKALGEDGNPSFETMRSILSAMGLRLTVEPAEAA